MRRMTLFVIMAAFAPFGLAAEQPAAPNFSVTIAASKPLVHVGEPIYIRIKMTNLSANDVDCSSFYVNGTDRRFAVEVKDSTGKDMKRADAHPEQMPGSFQQCSLAPGESTVEKEFLVSGFHDLSRPGTYEVQVSRKESTGDSVVKSNVASIKVEP